MPSVHLLSMLTHNDCKLWGENDYAFRSRKSPAAQEEAAYELGIQLVEVTYAIV